MTKSKLLTPMARSDSKHKRHINRLFNTIDRYKETIKRRNKELNKYRLFVKHLIRDKRVTKLELSKYITKTTQSEDSGKLKGKLTDEDWDKVEQRLKEGAVPTIGSLNVEEASHD